MATGPKGRARWRKESASAIFGGGGDGRSKIWPVSRSEEIVRGCGGGEWLLCSALWPLEVVVRGSNCVWEISR